MLNNIKNKPLVLLVHGFNVYNPEKSVGKLRTFFEVRGCPTVIINYGHTGLIETRRKNPKIAKKIAAVVSAAKKVHPNREVIVVGHSNGCAIMHLATTKYAAAIDTSVYINPALEKHLAPGAAVKRCHVWHSPSDKPVKWGKRLSRIIPKRWFNARPWGEMGAVGYIGTDKRMFNFNKQADFLLVSREHSDMFKWSLLPYFGELIANEALDH
ncbi:MAG: alpha/beta hydrolase [Gammaproteobacteria bacterium]|nr:alpha/beta hydrolase [Gammaproteobacteria bacterium]